MMKSDNLDNTFSALADATRRAILNRLSHGDATVSELAKPFVMSLPGITKHLNVLEKAGLITKRKQGRTKTCSLNADRLKIATSWLEYHSQFWEGRLDTLEKFMHAHTKEKKRKEKL